MRLVFRLSQSELPSIEDQYMQLWQFAKILTVANRPLDSWHPPAPTREEAINLKAFNDSGPTEEAISIIKAHDSDYSDEFSRTLIAWYRAEGKGSARITIRLNKIGICRVDLSSSEIHGFLYNSAVQRVILESVKIWPDALFVEAGPYKYVDEKVFDDRPGVGWMLYLPCELSQQQVPEARHLRYVFDDNHKLLGTIISSVVEGKTFDVDNPEHVKVANDIEIRLVDQDLLPLYANL